MHRCTVCQCAVGLSYSLLNTLWKLQTKLSLAAGCCFLTQRLSGGSLYNAGAFYIFLVSVEDQQSASFLLISEISLTVL